MSLSRYSGFFVALISFLALGASAATGHISWWWSLAPFAFALLGVHDMAQTRHSILRNYPILGHLRFMIEAIRPELRQYLVEDNDSEKPFSRAQRSVVYQRAKNTVDSRAFGTELNVNQVGHEFIAHSLSPTVIDSADFRITVGASRAKPYSMSVFNISAMSFGALSANAIRALNRGAKMGNFAHDTGEGSLSKYHRENGGDIVFQIASGYFGCRTPDGRFDADAFVKQASLDQVKMIEVKLSQGAKPGHGGVLPAAKVTPEIAETRGVPMGQDCISPAAHSEFNTPAGLLQFIERLRNLSGGKPTGFKFCVGQATEWMGIVKAMLETGILPDFIVVDGAEGGTGAAPLEFADHVGTPLQEGLRLVHNTLVGVGLRGKIRIGASGKIISAFDMARTFALGADFLNSARGYMYSIGCLNALTCSTGKCPTGVATQDPIRQKAIVVSDKAERVYYFHKNSLHALQELLQATGLHHPGELEPKHIVRRVSSYQVERLSELLDHLEPGSLLNGECDHPRYTKWWAAADAHSFHGHNVKAVASSPKHSSQRVIWCKVDQLGEDA